MCVCSVSSYSIFTVTTLVGLHVVDCFDNNVLLIAQYHVYNRMKIKILQQSQNQNTRTYNYMYISFIYLNPLTAGAAYIRAFIFY